MFEMVVEDQLRNGTSGGGEADEMIGRTGSGSGVQEG